MKIRTEGVKGKGYSRIAPIGRIDIFLHNENEDIRKLIEIDNFVGQGNDYKERETPLINISNGNFFWSGTFDELVKKLSDGK